MRVITVIPAQVPGVATSLLVMTGAASQVSVAVALPLAATLVSAGQLRVVSGGHTIVGGVTSVTVMVWTQEALLPLQSVAVQVRLITVVPAHLPGVGASLLVMAGDASQVSVAVALPLAATLVSAGQLRGVLTTALQTKFGPKEMHEIHMSLQVFPEHSGSQNGNGGSGKAALDLYPELEREDLGNKAARLIKRFIDIVGSLSALILLAPVLLTIAIAVKLTSKGPILFRQERIGQYGIPFTFLKFRSMYDGNDPRIHQEYLKQFIAGKDCKQADGNGGAYKLRNDPRITPIGGFLRKSSLDELPMEDNGVDLIKV